MHILHQTAAIDRLARSVDEATATITGAAGFARAMNHAAQQAKHFAQATMHLDAAAKRHAEFMAAIKGAR